MRSYQVDVTDLPSWVLPHVYFWTPPPHPIAALLPLQSGLTWYGSFLK
jgi:hypothetical protein